MSSSRSKKRKETMTQTDQTERETKQRTYGSYRNHSDEDYDEKTQRQESFQGYQAYQGYRNTPIEDTLFTAGMEFEPNPSNASYYTSDDDSYDRKTVFKSGTSSSSVTIEEYDISKNMMIEDDALDKACPYNIELNIGVLGLVESSKLVNFIDNKDYFIPEIETELEEFKTGFYQKNKNEHIRRLYLNRKDIEDNIGYRDCALTEELGPDEKSSLYYVKAYDDPNNIVVTPQVTIGLSYALYPQLLRAMPGNIINTISHSLFHIIRERNFRLYNSNTYKVFEGFLYVIINYCLTAAYFHDKNIVTRMRGQGIDTHRSAGFDYFKMLFQLKPRINLAESYKYLQAEYEGFTQLFDIVYDNVFREYNTYISKFEVEYTFDPSLIGGYTDLVMFHINLLKEITSKDELLGDIKDRLNSGDFKDESNIYQDIVAFVINQEDHFRNDLLKIVGLVNIIYLMYQIRNPRKVVRLRFLDRSKVGDYCKILDGYFFFYEGDSINKIDDLENRGLVEVIENKVYDFAHTSDPVILTLERGKICTQGHRREEIFELMPTNSNLVIEFRDPDLVARFIQPQASKTISFSNIVPFLKSFFNGLHRILAPPPPIQLSSLEPSSRSYCTFMFNPVNNNKLNIWFKKVLKKFPQYIKFEKDKSYAFEYWFRYMLREHPDLNWIDNKNYALLFYQTDNGYRLINKALREFNKENRINRIVSIIDKSLNKEQSGSQVFRGIIQSSEFKFSPYSTYREYGYSSTSLNFCSAIKFLYEKSCCVLSFKITNDILSYNYDNSPYGFFSEEKEILVQRNINYFLGHPLIINDIVFYPCVVSKIGKKVSKEEIKKLMNEQMEFLINFRDKQNIETPEEILKNLEENRLYKFLPLLVNFDFDYDWLCLNKKMKDKVYELAKKKYGSKEIE